MIFNAKPASALFPFRHHTHCASHRLNWVQSRTFSTTIISNKLGIDSEASRSMSRLAARPRLLEGEVEANLPESRRKRIESLCWARWVEQHDRSTSDFDQPLPAVVPALDNFQVGYSS